MMPAPMRYLLAIPTKHMSGDVCWLTRGDSCRMDVRAVHVSKESLPGDEGNVLKVKERLGFYRNLGPRCPVMG